MGNDLNDVAIIGAGSVGRTAAALLGKAGRRVVVFEREKFIEGFLNPQHRLQIPAAVNAVLGGNIFGSFAVKWRMWIFYLLVLVQKHFSLYPRQTLLPNGIAEPTVAETATGP